MRIVAVTNQKGGAGKTTTTMNLAAVAAEHSRVLVVDVETNWFTVVAFRDLAVNLVGSVVKGQRVVVVGRLRLRDWESGDRSGTTVEVEAETIGHDLRWGEAVFTRANRTVPLSEDPVAG